MTMSFLPEVALGSNDVQISEYKGIKDGGLQFSGLVSANIKI